MAKQHREQRTPRGVRAVDHAMAVLNAFGDNGAALDLSKLSAHVGLSKSAVHALLVSLERGGLVCRDGPSARYTLGPRLVQLASLRLRSSNVTSIARPVLERLVQETGETAFLGLLEGDLAVYADRIESWQRLRVVGEIGAPVPLHATALGKALLAHLPDERIARELACPLERYTRQTIVDPERLRAELAQVREQGYAVSLGERDEFTIGVAAPIWNHENRVVAAVTVAAVHGRADVQALIEPVIRAAAEISRRLGATRESLR